MAVHFPKVFSTNARVDGVKMQIFVLSCPCFKKKDPNHKGSMNFRSRKARDREMLNHK